MKKLSFSYLFLFLGLSALMFTSCDPDETGGGTTTGASVSLLAEPGFVSEDGDIAPGTAFQVRLQALAGESDLQSVTFYEDGFEIPGADITISGIDIVNNPQLIIGDVNEVTWDITLTAPSTNGTYIYEFEVTDVAQVRQSATLSLTVGDDTPFEINFPNGGGGAPIATSPDALIEIDLDIPAGSSTLNTIAVYEDGALISDLTRLRYKDVATDFTDNPQAFADEDLNGFTGSIYVKALTGAHDLTFEVTTAAGDTATGDISYNAGTAVEELTGVLLNAAGPAGTGGLDLDTGDSTGSNDAAAEIKDEGIDTDQPVDVNWVQRISGVNGSEIRTPDMASLPEGFSYTSVSTQEEIVGTFDTGATLSNNTTGVVQTGDMFVVKNGNNYYLLLATDVVATTSDNADFYEFSIKK